MTILQRQLFTLYWFLDVEGNASTTLSPSVPSEQPVAVGSHASVVGYSYFNSIVADIKYTVDILSNLKN